MNKKPFNHRRIQSQMILKYMAQLEDLQGKCFVDIDSELEIKCMKAMDGETPATFVINQLTRMIDEAQNAK
jgi:hypothetical protein